MSFLGFDKWVTLMKLIAFHGGPFKSLYKFWRMDSLKLGKYMGRDSFGNKYYENNYFMLSRNRWVEYNITVRWDYCPSQVTPDWHAWLHHMTDRLPHEDPAKYCIYNCAVYNCWLLPHQENPTATPLAYYGYSTVKPKISPWDGNTVCVEPCLPVTAKPCTPS